MKAAIDDKRPRVAHDEAMAKSRGLMPERPFLYGHGRISGTREAVAHPNNTVIYRVGETAIDVLAVVHSRQRYP